MYEPEHFKVEDREALIGVMRAHPLAQLITAGPGGLMANPIPFIVVGDGEDLILRAHLARANPQWRELEQGVETLLVFQSVERYVTPSWYETKLQTGKVVPTWNYVIVQARGVVRVDDSPEWLRNQIDVLTDQQEASVGSSWQVGDAPDAFVTAQLRGIVGVEMTQVKLTGKFKLSQNRPEADKRGVASGLDALPNEDAHTMSELVRLHGKIG